MTEVTQGTGEGVKRIGELPSKCWYYREFITEDWQIGMLKGEYGKYAQQRLENQLERQLVEKFLCDIFTG